MIDSRVFIEKWGSPHLDRLPCFYFQDHVCFKFYLEYSSRKKLTEMNAPQMQNSMLSGMPAIVENANRDSYASR
jgi:hypothetical protein